MEEARKRQAGEVAADGEEDSAVKRPKTAEPRVGPQDDSAAGHEDEDEDGCMSAWLALDEDAVSELLSLLEPAESSSPSSSSSSSLLSAAVAGGGAAYNFKVNFIDDPYASPVVFQSSSSFVTINGNEETCGSSFSESESTVMASIDTRGIAAALRGAEDERGGGAWASSAGAARGCGAEGCDCAFAVDDDDAAALAGFLGSAGGGDDAFDWNGVNAGCS